MDAALRTLVRDRAGGRCEYCRLHQDDADFLTFHVEHILARQHGGLDEASNLCLACAECNWAKGPNVAGVENGKVFRLFHPRTQKWKRHFRWDGVLLVGKTFAGRVTVQVLNVNDPARVLLRDHLSAEDRFPPVE